jgi:hypothetical protein
MEHFLAVGRRNAQKLIFLLFLSPLSQLSRIRQRIGQLARQRREAERALLERSALVKGALLEVQRTCGNPGCKCARGQKHSCWQLSASVERKTRTWNVPRRYVAKIKELTGNYRRFRRARRPGPDRPQNEPSFPTLRPIPQVPCPAMAQFQSCADLS